MKAALVFVETWFVFNLNRPKRLSLGIKFVVYFYKKLGLKIVHCQRKP